MKNFLNKVWEILGHNGTLSIMLLLVVTVEVINMFITPSNEKISEESTLFFSHKKLDGFEHCFYNSVYNPKISDRPIYFYKSSSKEVCAL